LGHRPEFTRRSGACGWFRQRPTELNPWYHRDSPNGQCEPANRYFHATDRDYDSPNHPGFYFAKWNSQHNRTGVELTEPAHSRKHNAAINRQSEHPEHPEYPWHFAQRFAVWNLAWHGKRSVRLYAKHGIVEFESVDPWEPGQHQRKHVAGK